MHEEVIDASTDNEIFDAEFIVEPIIFYVDFSLYKFCYFTNYTIFKFSYLEMYKQTSQRTIYYSESLQRTYANTLKVQVMVKKRYLSRQKDLPLKVDY